MRRLILRVAALLFLLAPGLGHGQSVSAADARAVRQVIEAQLDAFYRPRSVSFEEPLMAREDLVQPVRITDGDGHTWMAIYPMAKQPDGSWRINGCHLARLPARET